ALRDVTATVESLPLIASSIMSKKMAEGIDALILDVKTGDGAFMKKFEDSKALAEAMVRIGRGMGKKVSALITDMEQPLGRTGGDAARRGPGDRRQPHRPGGGGGPAQEGRRPRPRGRGPDDAARERARPARGGHRAPPAGGAHRPRGAPGISPRPPGPRSIGDRHGTPAVSRRPR